MLHLPDNCQLEILILPVRIRNRPRCAPLPKKHHFSTECRPLVSHLLSLTLIHDKDEISAGAQVTGQLPRAEWEALDTFGFRNPSHIRINLVIHQCAQPG